MFCSCSVDLTLTNLVLLGIVVFAVKKLIKLVQKWQMDKMLEKWENTPRGKVILHGVWRCKTMPSISPFALKVETYLRMAKIPYELDTKDTMGPKGKTPWITYNGEHVADSQLIVQYLNKKFSPNLNANAGDEQVATAKACRVMLEEHFLWGVIQFRWVENAAGLPQLIKLPTFFKVMLPLRAAHMKKRMEDQGIGKHTHTEIYQMMGDDLRTVSSILGNRKFLGGDVPCEEDCAVFGMISQVVWAMPGCSLEKLVNDELTNLKEYCDRMKDLYWPDWESCMSKS